MKPIVLAAALPLLAGPALADTLPLGVWARGDGNTLVRIEPCGGKLCAINTYVKDTSGGEAVGHRLVMDLKPSGPGRFKGTAFDPQRDRSYAMTLDFAGRQMSTRGCILGVICKTVSWTKRP